MFEKVIVVISNTQGSPLAPLKKGGNRLKVPLFKGDLGGSVRFATHSKPFKTPSKKAQIFLSCDFNEMESRFLETDLQLLPISIQDTIQQYHLPFYLTDHKDPFDRIIISQAISRSLPLVSKDKEFDAYPIEKVWI